MKNRNLKNVQKVNTYSVTYDKRVSGLGVIIVRAYNEEQAIKNAQYLCFTGSNFRNPVQVKDSDYTKPRKQGFYSSQRM